MVGVPIARTLLPFDATVLDQDTATIYAVSDDLRIAYVNGAWTRFAAANGAVWNDDEWGVGARIMDAIPLVLRPFYERLYGGVLASRTATEHDYECSSPTLLRRFRMRIFPCESGALLVVNSPLHESAHGAAGPALESLYRADDGIVRQCSHCRRVRRATEPAAWEWVPSYVERSLPGTSHGLCAVCSAFYYPEHEIAAPAETTVLVVDDEAPIRKVAARILRRLGYVVIEASNAGAGLRALDDAPVDVVLTDITMPDMDGIAMAAAMRLRRPRLCVVFMSGADSFRAHPPQLEGALFLAKPFSSAGVKQAIEVVLERRGARA